MSVLRWILVLPGGILGGFLLTFPLHWILLASCTRDDNLIILGPDAFATLEITLTGVVSLFGLVFFGSRIAPSHRLHTAWILAALGTALGIWARVALAASAQINPWEVAPLVANFVGLVLGLTGAYLADRHDEAPVDVDQE